MNLNFYPRASSLASLAFDPHLVIVPEQYFEPLIDVAHADPLLEQGRELRLGNSNAVILHRQVEALVFQPAATV